MGASFLLLTLDINYLVPGTVFLSGLVVTVFGYSKGKSKK